MIKESRTKKHHGKHRKPKKPANDDTIRKFKNREIKRHEQIRSEFMLQDPPDFMNDIYVIRSLFEIIGLRAEKNDSFEYIHDDDNDHTDVTTKYHLINPNYRIIFDYIEKLGMKGKNCELSDKIVLFDHIVCKLKSIKANGIDMFERERWTGTYFPDVRVLNTTSDVLNYIYNKYVLSSNEIN